MRVDRGLTRLLDELAPAVGDERRCAVAELGRRLAAGRLRVAVVGEAKRGKSTLVNALLGAAVLPVGVTPVTAVATTLCFGHRPRVQVHYLDGRVEEHPLAALGDLVTEAGNPGNRRGLAEVTAYLDVSLLNGGVELIDTPGVGSVFAQATTQAKAAHERLDAAIFVLTADPPMSASERDLLGEIAERAVALFVVLNKVDRLSPAEQDDAVRFVTDILAQMLPEPPHVYRVSTAAALRGDNRALDGLDGDLAAYLTARRDTDLARAVAGHATRIARASLDDVLLTLRAAELSAAGMRTQVDAFRACLGTVHQHRRDAADLIRASLARTRRNLDDVARRDGPEIVGQVRGYLGGALDQLTGGPHEIEEAGRTRAGDHAAALVASWCQTRREEITRQLRELDTRLTSALDRDLAAVRSAAGELLGLPLALPTAEDRALPTASVDATYRPDIGYTSDLAASIRGHLPGRLGRTMARRMLLQEVDELVPRLVGRARAAFQDVISAATTDLTTSIDRRYREATDGLITALAHAETLATASAETAAAHRAELAGRAETLRRLIDGLGSIDGLGAIDELRLSDETADQAAAPVDPAAPTPDRFHQFHQRLAATRGDRS